MTEEFIHYLWKYQLLKHPLYTVNNESIEVFSTGQLNKNSGPDYLNARIRIGDTLWAGDVEIHVRSSDWHLHGHSLDRCYDGVILHVVFENDQSIKRVDNQEIAALEIQGLFDEEIFERYAAFLSSLGWIPCEKSLSQLNWETWDSWFIFLTEERLARKSQPIEALLTSFKGHLELAFYQCLSMGFGLKVNTTPFEWLAQSVDLKLVMKYQTNLPSLEALLFGQAGFLNEPPEDEYTMKLAEEYAFLKIKHDLEPMPVHVWKFLRMRPSGFPAQKIAQWAAFLHHNADKLVKIIHTNSVENILDFFNIETSEYWWDHYHFNRSCKFLPHKPGKDTVLMILLNSVIPFLYVQGCRTGDQSVVKASIELLRNLPSEDNALIRRWVELGVNCDNALCSQALLELKNQYCDHKNCLHCAIGIYLLRNSSG
ncbi:MAG: DUF2851 family protein [Bacteroidales bacterium]